MNRVLFGLFYSYDEVLLRFLQNINNKMATTNIYQNQLLKIKYDFLRGRVNQEYIRISDVY